MFRWLLYLAALFGLFLTNHYFWLVIVGVIGFILCLSLTSKNSSRTNNNKELHMNERFHTESYMDSDEHYKHFRTEKYLDQGSQGQYRTTRNKRNNHYNYMSNSPFNNGDLAEIQEKERLERESNLLRYNDVESWEIDEIDRQLNRSQKERDFEDFKTGYDRNDDNDNAFYNSDNNNDTNDQTYGY